MSALRTQVRRFTYRHVGGTALVLIYHRIAALERDPQLLAVTPRHFHEQMGVLARDYRVFGLAELIDECGRQSVPNRAVAVTFDDGYADNLLEAMPVLERHGVPATVFVSSGYVESGREFWWDEVERIVLGAHDLPDILQLEVEGQRFAVHIGGAPPAQVGTPGSEWNVAEDTVDPRQIAYRDACAFIRPLSAAARASALEQLRASAGARAETRETHRPLSPSEVRALDASELMTVGAHTVNHPRLASRPLAEQREEILADKVALEALLGHPVDTFSYPYGGLDDYSAASVDIVRDAGFTGACANHPGVVKPWTNPLRLPRNLVRSWDAETFSARLEGWFDDPR